MSSSQITTLISFGIKSLKNDEPTRLQELLVRLLPDINSSLGRTTWIQHEINVGDTEPIRQKPYHISKNTEELII